MHLANVLTPSESITRSGVVLTHAAPETRLASWSPIALRAHSPYINFGLRSAVDAHTSYPATHPTSKALPYTILTTRSFCTAH